MKPIPVRQPQLSVVLHKIRRRTSLGDGAPAAGRFTSTARKIDLTPHLGDGSVVQTIKGVREPAGAFTITIPDKAYTGTQDDASGASSAETIYGLVEPMDAVEIRMHGGIGDASRPPIIMRGFVSHVRRSESMSGDGRPMRQVVIAGQDYGKLWQQLQIYYLPGYVVGEDTLTAFRLFERFGVGFQTAMRVQDFVRTTIAAIFDPYLQGVLPDSSGLPRTIVIDEDQLVEHGTTSISGPQNKEGTIYELLRTFGDVGAWNELFLEDREDGVFCVFRPNPYKRLNGTPLVADATMPPTVDIDGSDILSLDVGRTDENVANYFWVRSPRFDFINDTLMRQDQALGASADSVLLGKYQNTASDLYGIKLMELASEMGGDDVKTFNSGLPESDHIAREALMSNWINYRRRLLVEANKDNVVLEGGHARVRGNETLRAGRYVRIRRGSFDSEYYVSRVQHDFMVYGGFFTSLTLERGTGFVQRAARGGGSDSPYYAEISQ